MKQYIALFALLFSFSAQADKLVFVQGYLSEASNWQDAGIVKQLENKGWSSAGEYVYSSYGITLKNASVKTEKNQYFVIDLPTEASVRTQAQVLRAYLTHLRKVSPNERLILVAHSAGGVLSRLVMVQNPELNVSLLITISSPHLGSDLAQLASLVGSTPLAFFTPLIGAETLNRSQGLYQDLLPEKPGNFLYLLNRLEHPNAQYVSIIRDPNAEDGGDLVVPAYSHDMRNVAALRHLATSYIVSGGHSLNARDGLLIFDILTQHDINLLSFNKQILI